MMQVFKLVPVAGDEHSDSPSLYGLHWQEGERPKGEENKVGALSCDIVVLAQYVKSLGVNSVVHSCGENHDRTTRLCHSFPNRPRACIEYFYTILDEAEQHLFKSLLCS